MLKFPTLRRATAGGLPPSEKKVPALADPDNVASDIGPSDLANPDTTPKAKKGKGPDERTQVEYVRGRFEEARQGRAHLENTWLESLAFDMGGEMQWHYWDTKQQRFCDLRVPGEIDRYITDNQIRPIVVKVAALATTSKPAATLSGLTTRPIDQQAADEGRGVDESCDRLLDGDAQIRLWVDWALRSTTAYLKCYWHPTKAALIPVTGPDGTLEKVIRADVGDHCEEILSFAEGYPEPAKSHAKMRWFVHATVRPITELAEQYGDAAYGIETGDAAKDTLGYLESRLAFINGDMTGGVRDAKKRKTHALVLELWEKPTPTYPNGLFATVAGNRCLRWQEELPDEYRDELPFIPLDYQQGLGTVYARNLVQDLISPQRAMNRAWSRIVERLEQDKLTVLVPKGAKLDPDAFREPEREEGVQERRNLRFVYHTPGLVPDVVQVPPMNAEHFALTDRLLLRMQNIAGVHDVSQGIAPTSGASGVLVQSLQQGDRSQLALFTGNIESAVRKRTEWRLRHYAQHCKDNLPRLVGLSENGDPQAAMAGAKALVALTAGGQVRVKMTPGSAIPKFPEQQDARILEMAKAGMFAQDALPSTIAILKAMAMEGSDDLARDLVRIFEGLQAQAQANAPDPARAALKKQQMQQQAAEAAQHVQIDHEAQMANIDLHQKVAIINAQAEADIARLHAERSLPPAVSLSAKADPTATVEIEAAAGFKGAQPPPAPVKPMTKPTPKGN